MGEKGKKILKGGGRAQQRVAREELEGRVKVEGVETWGREMQGVREG